MNRARSLADGTDWDAADFGARDLLWRARHRGMLHCLGCGRPAIFKEGTGVRAPFFAATHEESCALLKGPWTAFRYLQ